MRTTINSPKKNIIRVLKTPRGMGKGSHGWAGAEAEAEAEAESEAEPPYWLRKKSKKSRH